MLVTIISVLALVASIVLCRREIVRQHAETRCAASTGQAASPHGADAPSPIEDDPVRDIVRPRRMGADIAWAVVFWALQAFLIVWSALGLVQQDPISALVVNAVLAFCAWASFAHDRVAAAVREFQVSHKRLSRPLVGAVSLILLAGVFAMLALELPSNHCIWLIWPLCLLLEWFLITVVLAGLYFLFQRHGAAPAVLCAGLFVLGIAEYFVITFKNQPIQPGDLTALSTAAAVAGTGYTYSITAYCLYGMAALALALLCCSLASLLVPVEEERRFTGGRAVAANLLVGVLCLAAFAVHVTCIDYYNLLRIQVYSWRPLDSYYHQGYLPTFISAAQTIRPPVPEDYDYDDAAALLEEYAAAYDEDPELGASPARVEAEAQYAEERPAVIAIMNETFSDLSIYQNLHAGYEGPAYFNSIPDALARGPLYVSAYGGGTANSEFEFLTGNSMAYLGPGVYPYTLYDLSETENLARQFDEAGYTTTAMHPNHATNWNRENVYSDFGFDDFLDIDDFEGSETLRGMVTDAATYDKILELLDADENPQFIFDVTMQNHSGYDTGLIPYSKRVSYEIDGRIDTEVNEYLSLIDESDRALEEFLNELRQLDRKVVVVFFGDHQPFFPDRYNNAWFKGEDDAVHAERLWQTDYVIWANYDVAGCDQTSEERDLSANYLAAYLMQLIGAPLTDYQKAQLVISESMPAINTTGFASGSYSWYLTGDDPATDGGSGASGSAGGDGSDGDGSDGEALARAHADLETLQYYKLFGDGKDIYTRHQQSAGNEIDPNARQEDEDEVAEDGDGQGLQ